MGWLKPMETREGSIEAGDGGVVLSKLFGGKPTATGQRVDSDAARKYSAYFRGVAYSAGHIGTLPLSLYEETDDGEGREVLRGHPSHRMVHSQANPEMSATSYREAGQGHALTRGNHYAEIVRNGRGEAEQLWPLNPDETHLKHDDNGTPFYTTKVGGETVRLAFNKVLHVPGLGFDGRTGYSVLDMARESVGLGLAGEEYSARFFGNNATPSGVLQSPTELSKEAKQRLKNQWEAAQGGLENQHRVAVLEGDISWQSLGISAEDAQLLEMREFSVQEMARWFGIPPHKLMDLSRSTFNNAESQAIEVLVDHIRPWAVRWEQALNNQVLTDQQRNQRGLFFKFNLDGLLRADAQTRAEKMRTEFNIGMATVNELRALEERNPIDSEAADTPFVRRDMIPLDQAQELPPTQRALLRAVEDGDPDTITSLVDLRREELTQDNETRERTDAETRSVQRRRELVSTWQPLFERDLERMIRAEIQDIRSERSILVEDGVEAFVEFLTAYYARDGNFPGLVDRTVSDLFRQFGEAATRVAADQAEVDPLGELELDAFMGQPTDESDTYVGAFTNRYSQNSRTRLERALRDGVEREDATPQETLERELDGWQEDNDDGRPRPEQKADWEANQASNAVAKATFVAGGITVLRWQTVGNNCPMCEAIDGTVVDVDSNFIDEGDELVGTDDETTITPQVNVGHPPLHSGCDCLIMPG